MIVSDCSTGLFANELFNSRLTPALADIDDISQKARKYNKADLEAKPYKWKTNPKYNSGIRHQDACWLIYDFYIYYLIYLQKRTIKDTLLSCTNAPLKGFTLDFIAWLVVKNRF